MISVAVAHNAKHPKNGLPTELTSRSLSVFLPILRPTVKSITIGRVRIVPIAWLGQIQISKTDFVSRL